MKRRERLVMITSSAHIIVVAASGQEKKAKMDMSLLGRGVAWKSFLDAKNLMAWSVDTVSSVLHLTLGLD